MRQQVRKTPNPGARIAVGDALFAAARTLGIPALAPELSALDEEHGRFLAAAARVKGAEAALRSQSGVIGEVVRVFKERIDELATQLCADKMPRRNPFKPFRMDSPSAILRMPYPKRIQVTNALVRAIQARQELSHATLALAANLSEAATALAKAIEPMPQLEKACTVSRHERDAIGQDWDARYKQLQLAARMAEAKGAAGLHTRLFKAITRNHTSRPKQAPEPAPTATMAQAPAVAE